MARLVTILFWLMTASAQASEPSLATAQDHLRQGEFAQAAAQGQALGTADGDAVAAKSYLILAAYVETAPERRLAMLDAAAEAAQRALAHDPDHVGAKLHLVVALGYKARVVGKWAANRAGYGGQAKALMKQVEDIAPDDPWLHAIRGGWNAEVVAVGGTLGAFLYGASKANVHDSFRRAIDLDPEDPALRVEYAKAMLFLDRKLVPAARHQLELAAQVKPRDAFEAILADQGRALLAALEDGGTPVIAAALDDAMPFFGRDRIRP